MRKIGLRVGLIMCGVLTFCLQLAGQTLQITDESGHSTSFSPAEISKLPHVTVDVKDRDTPARFEGVPLSALLSSVGIPMGDKLKGPLLAEGVLIEAADGYKVLFALAEFDPAFATREIILADKRDGRPLDGKEGPFRVVAPSDKRPARWIRQVATMKVVLVK
jgi:hypothetical protein